MIFSSTLRVEDLEVIYFVESEMWYFCPCMRMKVDIRNLSIGVQGGSRYIEWK